MSAGGGDYDGVSTRLQSPLRTSAACRRAVGRRPAVTIRYVELVPPPLAAGVAVASLIDHTLPSAAVDARRDDHEDGA